MIVVIIIIIVTIITRVYKGQEYTTPYVGH